MDLPIYAAALFGVSRTAGVVIAYGGLMVLLGIFVNVVIHTDPRNRRP